MTEARYRLRFLTTVLIVWAIVVGAATFKFLMADGDLPDPILLGIPTTVWLAVYPPLPRALREAEAEHVSG